MKSKADRLVLEAREAIEDTMRTCMEAHLQGHDIRKEWDRLVYLAFTLSVSIELTVEEYMERRGS